MENQPAAQGQNARIPKAELLARIDRAYANLEKTISGLSERQLTAPGPEKWSVKDHLAHMAVWELGVAELLLHHDRLAAMNVDPLTFRTKSEDEINEVIYQHQANLTLEQVLLEFKENHRRMLEVLNSLSDEDLYRPYAYFVEDKRNAPQSPVINSIVGNTNGHFDQHNPWIQSLLEWLKTNS